MTIHSTNKKKYVRKTNDIILMTNADVSFILRFVSDLPVICRKHVISQDSRL